MSTLSLYDKDFYAWTQEQARLIKNKEVDKLDLMHLLEEVESMGVSEVRELESRLEVLLTHLLKWKYQPNLQSKSWQLTIKEQRNRIKRRIKKMPSLQVALPDTFNDSYEDAIYTAARETGLSEKTFPQQCEWTIDEVLSDDFFPN